MDFMPKMETLTFSPSDAFLDVAVDIISDDIPEAGGGEVFLGRIRALPSNPIQVDILDGVATILIVEDPSTYAHKCVFYFSWYTVYV